VSDLAVDMTWAWLAVVGIAAGLPTAAWLLSRNLKPQRQRGGHLGFGRIDRWLAEHYQLGALDRWQIEETIFRDVRKLDNDPRLRDAARGLAAELLSGRLKPLWLIRWSGWVLISSGVVITALGIILHSTRPDRGVLGIYYMIEGPLGVLLGAAVIIWTPRQVRRNLVRLSEDRDDSR
jgi:hypothetical protein